MTTEDFIETRTLCEYCGEEVKVVGGTYYGGWPGRWWLPALKPAAPLQGTPFRRDLRDLRESIVRSPAQAWRAVVMAVREMQRSTCPQSAVR